MARLPRKERPSGDFGRILRGHRERIGLTLNALARKIEMDQGLLSKIERGKRPPPQIVPHVQRIAAALGFPNGSSEFRELLAVAYRERFGGQKWPDGIVSLSLEEGQTVLTHTPVVPHGLGEYAPPESREIMPPDSPLRRELGLYPEQHVAVDRAQFGHETAFPWGPAGMASLSPMGLVQQILAALGATITRFEQQGESFNLEIRLPDFREYQIKIGPKGLASTANGERNP
jgi:transcriptional regulator with XRE-family HTH domain